MNEAVADTVLDVLEDAPVSRPTAHVPVPGERVGRFTIIQEVARGGMGTVLAAYDPYLDRRVAIKVLRAERVGGGAEAQERMIREARAMASISHPNVLTVHEVGKTQHGIFIATEFASGGTLRDWLTEGSRSWQQVVARFVEAGRGLAAAHRAGLIHRDFKPSNVLLTGDGQVKVADFGLVAGNTSSSPGTERDCPVIESSTDSLTLTGSIVGTPSYMAPEQHAGEPVGSSADQFSFCVALYEGLYGYRPFEGLSYPQLADAVLAGDVAPRPARTLVPSQVHAIILRGLDVEPDARHDSMEALLAELQAALEVGRRRWRVPALAAVVAVIVVAGLWASSRGPAPCGDSQQLRGIWDEGRRHAVMRVFEAAERPHAQDVLGPLFARFDTYARDWTEMQLETCRATRVEHRQSPELFDLRMACLRSRRAGLAAAVDVLAEAGPAELDMAHELAAALPPLDACADVFALRSVDAPPTDPRERARAAEIEDDLAEAKALFRIGRLTAAATRAEQLVSSTRELGYRPLQADALLLAGRLADARGEYENARWVLRDAHRWASASADIDIVISARIALASVLGMRLEQFRDGHAWLEDAEAALAQLEDRPELRRELLGTRAMIAMGEGDYAAAESTLSRALALVAHDQDSPEAARLLLNAGTAVELQGRFDEALALQREALAVWIRAVGRDHPEVGSTLNNIAITLAQKGAGEEALQYFRRALATWERAYGPAHPQVAHAHNNIGLMLLRAGDYVAGRAEIERAIEIWNQRLGADNYRLATAFLNIGASYRMQGRHPAALEALERARALTVEHVGSEHIDLADVLLELGRTHTQNGDGTLAVPLLERAEALHLAHPGNPAALAEVRAALAHALWDLDRKRATVAAATARDAFSTAGNPYQQQKSEMDELLAGQ